MRRAKPETPASGPTARDASTLDFGSMSRDVHHPSPDPLALMIAWAPYEPDRIGEVTFFDPGAGVRVLGRGEPAGAGAERVSFVRQRPGTSVQAAPLASPGISREQLRISVDDGALRVERVGKCRMVASGLSADRCVLHPGDTLLLWRQMLLYCTRRRRRIEPFAHASSDGARGIGEPDEHGIVGESPAAWLLRDRIAWAARAAEHTLLLGPSGSGKELVARAVHSMSSLRGGPFIARNAATIPASLVDAELFGNVKGYPNPGMPERPGLVGAAHGGTLFLDEIGELPQALHANLLRVLDEGGEYHPLGASHAKRASLRLVGATNRDPSVLKHDLLARLVVRLAVPGLGERRDDIPMLVRHLLRRAAVTSPDVTRRFLSGDGGGPAEPSVSAGLVDQLLRHEYSTHVRELNALLWRAMGESTGAEIDAIEGLHDDSLHPSSPASDTGPKAAEQPERPEVPDPPEEDVRAALVESGGNVTRAARALGLSSRYVMYRLLRKYGIEGGD